MAIQAEERKLHPLKHEEETLLVLVYSTSKSIFTLVNGCFCIQAFMNRLGAWHLKMNS